MHTNDIKYNVPVCFWHGMRIYVSLSRCFDGWAVISVTAKNLSFSVLLLHFVF